MTNREKARPWTDEELGFLEDHMEWTGKRIGQEIGRSAQSVRQKRNQLRHGWVPTYPTWTDDEVDILRGTAHMTAKDAMAILPGRSERAIQMMRSRLAESEGISWGGKGVNRSPHQPGFRRIVAKTCNKCEELMDARWYNRDQKTGCWSPTCTACRRGRLRTAEVERLREKYRAGHRSRQVFHELTVPAERSGQRWDSEDLRTLADPDLTILEKALGLKRTYEATLAQLSRHGFTSRIGLGEKENGKWRIDNPNAPEQAA